MSVGIGFVSDNYAVVACDSRYTNNVTGEIGICEKLTYAPTGFFAGGGGVCYQTTQFWKLLNTRPINSHKDVLTAFKDAAENCRAFAERYGMSETLKSLKTAQEIYTWSYIKDNTPKVGVYTVDGKYGTRKLLGNNTLYVAPPNYSLPIQLLVWIYTRKARKAKSIHAAMYLIACFMDRLAKITKTVDANCNFGITLRLDDNVLFMRIKEGAAEIKRLYKDKGDLSEMMMVVGKETIK